MDLKNIKAQLELSKKALSEYKKQNTIFEQILQNAIKGAPEEDQGEIEKIRILTIKVTNLAKAGKLEEAQTLIKDYQNGGQGN